MSFSIHAWAASDIGRKRRENEDGFLADTQSRIFIVCDGMGGHAAGETASAEALKSAHQFLMKHRAQLERYAKVQEEGGKAQKARQETLELIEQSVQAACSQIYSMALADARLRGMGTTLSLLLLRGDRAFIGHVGDSRIYLLRGGQVHQLTEDHTVLAQLLRQNRLSPEMIKRLPYRHSLSRAVGPQSTVAVDTFELEVIPEDLFLLCSDGLYEYTEDPALLLRLATDGPPEDVPKRMVDHANAQGGRDNITAMLVQLGPRIDQDVAQDTEVEQHRFRMATLGSIRLMTHLSYKELILVFNISEPRHYPAGATIIKEGEHGDALYILMNGQAQVSKGRGPVATLGKGDHFGEMALVDRVPRSATVTAITRVSARIIKRAPFYELLRSAPLLSNKILWNFVQVLSARLRETSVNLEYLQQELTRTATPFMDDPRRR